MSRYRPIRTLAARIALAIAALLFAGMAARAEPPKGRLAVLKRGVNLTNWFRYPPSADPAAIRGYMSDAAIADLAAAGFTFVRLPVQPEFLNGAPERMGLLAEAVGRLEEAGLGVVVELHPTTWHLETVQADRDQLATTWRALAAMLAPFDPALTFPEIVNEPVFTNDIEGWEALQSSVLAIIRAALPNATVVLTGNDWGSLDGLLRLQPVADGNVVYSFHFYEPRVLVLLADWAPSLNQTALATLPFPVSAPCVRTQATGDTLATMNYYCNEDWNGRKVRDLLEQAAQWAARNDVRVLMGEFGATHALNADARLKWMSDVRRDDERLHIGWALWGYDDVMGFNLPRPPGERPSLDPGVLRALGLEPPPG